VCVCVCVRARKKRDECVRERKTEGGKRQKYEERRGWKGEVSTTLYIADT
jgi:hypothetical protein